MRKFTIFLVLLLFCGLQAAFAQKTITGKVTSADDGTPLIGVTVIIKSTTIGTTTDINGKYSIEVPDDAEALLFSFVGMATQEIAIGDKSVIDVQLAPSAVAMDEVVVTALGVTREEKSLGYAVQDVSAEEINKARPVNVLNALSGKVSGVQISNATGNIGGSSRITIRGIRSMTGDNQPIFIVDGTIIDNSNFTSADQARGGGGYDYGNMANDINPDDIKSVSVLKGPAASALYGSRAANGVIIIETKKGEARAAAGKKGIGVTINTGASFDQVSILPKYQNQYGGGFGWDTLWYSEHPEGFPGRTSGYYSAGGDSYDLMPNYAVDESWGAKLNGQMHRPWYSWQENNSEFYGKNQPWEAHEDNIRDFYKLGQTWTNNIALTGGSKDAFFRLSYTNVQQHGVAPNSKRNKNTINFSGNTKLGEKLTAFTNFNYINVVGDGLVGTGYDNDGRNVVGSFNQWFQRQLDMEKMHDYWLNPDGTQNSWNRTAWDNAFPKYWDNPYWTRFKNFGNDTRDRVFGNIGFTYEFTDWLKLTGKVNKDFYTDRREERIAVGSNATSQYAEGIRQLSETNTEFLLEFNKYLTEDLSLKALVGGNQMTRKYNRNVGTTAGGLPIPGFYNLANTTDPVIIDDFTSKKRINSLYGAVSLGWRSMIYVDLTARNDWSSTLPTDNNSYFYPSATASFVFSELPALNDISWLSMGKVRFAWAKVGNDTDPYNIYSVYTPKENFGSNPLYTVPNQLNNAELKPEQTTSMEFGGNLKFFNNRLGIDATYYTSESTDQIIPIPISGSTGYTSAIVNAGQIDNKGIELFLTGTPVMTKDFTWDIYINWSKNTSEVVELADGIEQLRLVNAPFSVSVNAFTGEPYGTIMGRDYVYENGQKFVNANGMYEASENVVPLGNIEPDWIGGIGNTLRYKDISFSFLFDFRKGGDLFSTSYMWGIYSGIIEESVENNIREEGIVLEGVMEDPNNPGQFITNDQNIDANTFGLNHYFVGAMNMFKTDFIKLREVSLTYNFPEKWVTKTPFENVSLTLYGRNLLVFATDIEHIDPEHVISADNIQGIEGAQLPATRSFGFNLSVNL